MPRGDIASFGFSVSGPAGPFRIELERIDAHMGLPDYEVINTIQGQGGNQRDDIDDANLTNLTAQQQVKREMNMDRDKRKSSRIGRYVEEEKKSQEEGKPLYPEITNNASLSAYEKDLLLKQKRYQREVEEEKKFQSQYARANKQGDDRIKPF